MNKTLHVLAVFLVVSVFSAAKAAEITPDANHIVYVTETGSGNGSTWENATDNLQAAIDADGVQQVWVAKGTYQPASGQSFNMKKDVKIYGGFAGGETDLDDRDWEDNTTTLKGNGNRVLLCDGADIDAGTVLDGFTITGGNISGNGGGMYNNNSSPTIANCTFSENTASSTGGGMYNNSSSPTVTNCVFTGNKATSTNFGGGGICNISSSPTLTNVTISDNTATNGNGGGMHNQNSSPSLTNVIIRNNAANSGGGIYNYSSAISLNHVTISNNTAIKYGGGMYNEGSSSITITDCSFTQNSADNSGGGIYNINSSPTITNCTFTQNSAVAGGGGIYIINNSLPVITGCTLSQNTAKYGGGIYNEKTSPAAIANCTFTNNTATGSNADEGGGAIYNWVAAPPITNCLFTGNKASNSNGGGIFNYENASPTITNCTFTQNQANTSGGGLYNFNNSSPHINNSIIWGNTQTDGTAINNIMNGNNSAPIFGYCLVQGSNAGWDNFGTDNGNNIDADPLFANANGGDFALTENSPAINAGDNSMYSNLSPTTKDLAGNPRLYNNGIIDMGAYEFQGDPAVLPVTLIDLTAKADGNRAKLQWQTTSETNNKGFIVYRSGDDGIFVEIGDVRANNHSPLYTFTDKNPLNGNNYYKLVQIDNDGGETNLGVRLLTYNLKRITFNLYPNPTYNEISITFAAGSFTELEVTDLNGRILQHVVLHKTENSKTVSLGAYPAGTYLIRLMGKDHNESGKVVKR